MSILSLLHASPAQERKVAIMNQPMRGLSVDEFMESVAFDVRYHYPVIFVVGRAGANKSKFISKAPGLNERRAGYGSNVG